MDDDGGKAWRWRGMVAESILQPPITIHRVSIGGGERNPFCGCSLWCAGAKGALAKGNHY